MNDCLTASSHPLRLSQNTLNLYLNPPPTSYPRTFNQPQNSASILRRPQWHFPLLSATDSQQEEACSC